MCVFCDWDENLRSRVVFDRPGWFGFLAAPFHTAGHTILAAKKVNGRCPQGFSEPIFAPLGEAMAELAAILKVRYAAKDVLIGSVRGDKPHFHFHLLPFQHAEEAAWRMQRLYERGHLLEFMGYLEQQGDERAMRQRIAAGQSDEGYRDSLANGLQREVAELRSLTGYADVLPG
jgi:diadenosine tetraphosphate (Ap4A) HIT family hydrolase